MPLYHSVLKKYTAPTCSLEILSRSPVNDRRSRRSQISPLSFQLLIHWIESETNPTNSTDPTQLTIALRGTLEQLQTLHTAIQNYLYRFLGKTDLSWLNPPSTSVQTPSNEISLQPKTLTQHTLQLGLLAGDIPASGIELASTQLFDLASTLDRYAKEAVEIVKQSQLRTQGWSARARIAAIAVGVIGLTGLLATSTPFGRNFLNPQLASKPSNIADNKIHNNPKSGVTKTGNQGILPTLPTEVPPPTSMGSPGALFGTPSGSPSGSPLAASIPTPNGTASPILAGKLAVSPSPVLQIGQLATPLPTATASGQTATAKFVPNAVKPMPQLSQGEMKERPHPPPTVAIANRTAGKKQQPSTPVAEGFADPYRVASAPAFEPIVPAPLPPPASADAQRSSSSLSNQELRPKALETLSPVQSPIQAARSSSNSGSGTVFDTIQQVGEVRQYFQGRWQPPATVNQVLEYHLMVNSDGSLWKIVPLGESAGRYLDKTGIPPVGVAFVSPIPGNQKAKIRLVLSPDGKVQTFLEGLNP